jgi:hypothetical protein
MVKGLTRFKSGSEPAWVGRARKVFDTPYDPSDKHPNVRPDPKDEEHYLRHFLIGGAAAAAALRPKRILANRRAALILA